MDLSKLEFTEGGVLTLLNPATNEELDARIQLAGLDSPQYRAYERKISNKRLNRAIRSAGGGRGGMGRLKVTAEEIEQENIRLLAECTLGWENIAVKGEELEFTVENAVQLYTDYPWIREQVDLFIGDRANFLPS